jgi:flagellin-like protein
MDSCRESGSEVAKMRKTNQTQNKEATKMKHNIRLFRTRKAVSPLIATVLLIAFAVALGAVVMNWGRGYVEDTANMARERSDSEVTCTAEVELSIVEIDSVPQICYNATVTGQPGDVQFILENKKAKEIYGFEARLIGENTRVPFNVLSYKNASRGAVTNLTMTANEAKFFMFEYTNATYGEPQQVKITPIIKVGANTVTCASNAETVTDLKPCSEVWE